MTRLDLCKAVCYNIYIDTFNVDSTALNFPLYGDKVPKKEVLS